MAETTTQVSIRPLGGETDLLSIYPRQQAPQECYLELDLETGVFRADSNPETGNAVPMSVWHGRTLHFGLPGPLLGSSANALLEHCEPLAQRILDGAVTEWDGNNNVGRRNADARAAEEEIEAAIDGYRDEWHYIHYWDAAEWFVDERAEHSTRLAEIGEDALVDELGAGEADGSEANPVLYRVREYVQEIADDLAAD